MANMMILRLPSTTPGSYSALDAVTKRRPSGCNFAPREAIEIYIAEVVACMSGAHITNANAALFGTNAVRTVLILQFIGLRRRPANTSRRNSRTRERNSPRRDVHLKVAKLLLKDVRLRRKTNSPSCTSSRTLQQCSIRLTLLSFTTSANVKGTGREPAAARLHQRRRFPIKELTPTNLTPLQGVQSQMALNGYSEDAPITWQILTHALPGKPVIVTVQTLPPASIIYLAFLAAMP
jgi:hypothetical protein